VSEAGGEAAGGGGRGADTELKTKTPHVNVGKNTMKSGNHGGHSHDFFAKKVWDSTAFPKFRLAQLLQITFTIGFLVDILKRIVGFITSLQLWGHQL